ncbi:SAM-dependent methyltransferase [Flavobacterium album]|uniref:SAM-dependent methyltransferase n=1 Tax=Flavobacterium album TaxID=2175091 RepID=A0A2S1QYL9_9FLAO|nr:class I SAM-dependent methyltransferase [Flavobacterium album]AWH85500.1 SAM-dependent methyltransferase [Flavobacterium album]
MYSIDPEIEAFYTQTSEASRLQSGLGPLEFERNKDLISRYLPHPGSSIADIGGGPGHYACWLAGLGHHVTLIDPVARHIQQAEKRSGTKHPFRCILGEARQLPLAADSVDIAILHGPLYHLQEEEERLAALREAKRILKPGGIVLGFAITYAASVLAALQNGMLHDPDIFRMCRQELSDGCHYPPERFPGMLAMAYFHKPSSLQEECRAAGFKPIGLFAVEGIVWLDNDFFASWVTPQKRELLLELVKLTESHPELLCISPHIMIAAKNS